MFSLEWMSFEWIICERDMQGQAPLLSILTYIAVTLWMEMLGRIKRAVSAGIILSKTGAALSAPSRGLEVHSEVRAYLFQDVTGLRCNSVLVHNPVCLQCTDPAPYFLLGDFHQPSSGCLLPAYKSTALQNKKSWETLNGRRG